MRRRLDSFLKATPALTPPTPSIWALSAPPARLSQMSGYVDGEHFPADRALHTGSHWEIGDRLKSEHPSQSRQKPLAVSLPRSCRLTTARFSFHAWRRPYLETPRNHSAAFITGTLGNTRRGPGTQRQ